MTRLSIKVFALFVSAFMLVQVAGAQTTEFTYQGQLQSSALPASGNFDFEFLLFDGAAGGSQVGATIARSGVTVAGGIFAVNLDFGSNFPGAGRFLEVRVRQVGGGAFTTLSPRQAIASSPYSVKSLNSDTATNAVNATNATIATTAVNATNSTNFTGSLAGDVTGMQGSTTVARLQTRNVANTAPADGQVLKFNAANNRWQPDTDNISAGGGVTSVTASGPLASSGGVTPNISLGLVPTANIADGAVTDAKIVTVSGAKVTGAVANATNATAAASATTAISFSGALSGDVTGTQNATSIASGAVTTAKLADNSVTNAKIVDVAGSKITGLITTATIPGANVAGAVANATNAINATNATTATNATQLNGQSAAFYQNATNIIAGTLDVARLPVPLTLIGNSGTHIIRGENASPNNFTSSVIGASTGGGPFNSGVEGRTNSTSGSGVFGTASAATGINQGVAGVSNSDTGRGVFGNATTNTGANVGVYGLSQSSSGTGVFGEATAGAGESKAVAGNTASSTGFAGYFTGPEGSRNFFQRNVGIGTDIPISRLHVRGSGVFNAPGAARFDISNPTSVGYFQHVGDTGLWQLATGSTSILVVNQVGGVGIGTEPVQKLDVLGNVRVGTGTTGCVEDRDGTLIAGNCSSDLRFKKNVSPYGSVLAGFAKLRPVTFDWRADEFKDRHFGKRRSFGLIAQDVENAFPDLVSLDEQGFRAVNYSRLPLLTIQAVNEQQTQIEAQQLQIEVQERQNRIQQKQIERQQMEIEVLKSLVCRNNRRAAICKSSK